MEAHSHAQVHLHERRASVATRTILQVGALAGIAAGLMYAAWQMVVAAIAQDPTAVPTIHQTLWTPPEGIWSVVFGVHHFHGSFHFIPVLGQQIRLAGIAQNRRPAASASIPKHSAPAVHCKAHDVDNLDVVDTNFFPYSSAVNCR